jgi:hypothetical protein
MHGKPVAKTGANAMPNRMICVLTRMAQRPTGA